MKYNRHILIKCKRLIGAQISNPRLPSSHGLFYHRGVLHLIEIYDIDEINFAMNLT
jgi:hypothetical protein